MGGGGGFLGDQGEALLLSVFESPNGLCLGLALELPWAAESLGLLPFGPQRGP